MCYHINYYHGNNHHNNVTIATTYNISYHSNIAYDSVTIKPIFVSRLTLKHKVSYFCYKQCQSYRYLINDHCLIPIIAAINNFC